VMGKPVKKNQTETQPDGALKSQKSSAGKRFRNFKKGGGLQQSIGNASKGHGLTHKARILSRFKKRFLSKRKQKKETLHIKPLAEDIKREPIHSQADLTESNTSGLSSLAIDESPTHKGRLTEIKKKKKFFVLKPSPIKTESPKTLFQRKQQGPRLTSSKLASSKNSKFDNSVVKRTHSVNNKRATDSIDGNDNKNNTVQPKKHFKKNPLGRSNDDLLKIDYHAIEEERQKEVLKIQSKKLSEEYHKKLNSNIQQRKSVSKNLKQRSKRGQPIMSNQIEHILEKVKKNNGL
uniref:Uncharacterized protein n=2 Tax=Clytia hemisphaerica TaxID=252671 RepID=A0A7M6DRU4_9CNID